MRLGTYYTTPNLVICYSAHNLVIWTPFITEELLGCNNLSKVKIATLINAQVVIKISLYNAVEYSIDVDPLQMLVKLLLCPPIFVNGKMIHMIGNGKVVHIIK